MYRRRRAGQPARTASKCPHWEADKVPARTTVVGFRAPRTPVPPVLGLDQGSRAQPLGAGRGMRARSPTAVPVALNELTCTAKALVGAPQPHLSIYPPVLGLDRGLCPASRGCGRVVCAPARRPVPVALNELPRGTAKFPPLPRGNSKLPPSHSTFYRRTPSGRAGNEGCPFRVQHMRHH